MQQELDGQEDSGQNMSQINNSIANSQFQQLYNENNNTHSMSEEDDELGGEEDDIDLDVSIDLDDDDDDDLDDDLLSDELEYQQHQQHENVCGANNNNVNSSNCYHRMDNQSYEGEDHLQHHQVITSNNNRGSVSSADLKDLQTQYHHDQQQLHQHCGEEMLNASTADFNKQIKQINQQLMNEGHLVDGNTSPSAKAYSAVEDGADVRSNSSCSRSNSSRVHQQALPSGHEASRDGSSELGPLPQADSPAITSSQQQQMLSSQSSNTSCNLSANNDASSPNLQKEQAESMISGMTLNRQESSAYSDQIDAQEINVVVPIEERSSRYTNRQHHNNQNNQNASANKQHHNQQSQGEQLESSVIRQPQIEEQSCCEQLATDHHQVSQRSGAANAHHHCQISKIAAQASIVDQQPHQSRNVVQKKSNQPSFKLDLAKVKNNNAAVATNSSAQSIKQSSQNQSMTINTTNRGGAAVKKTKLTADMHHSLQKVGGVRIAPGESVRTAKPTMSSMNQQDQLISVRKIQNQISLAQISERIPIKKNQNKSPQAAGGGGKASQQLNQSVLTASDLDASYQSAQILHLTKNDHQLPSQHQQNSKQVHIPKLALQNIHRQPSTEQQQNSNQPQSQLNHASLNNQQNHVKPRSLKVLTLSKRDDSVASNDLQQPSLLNMNNTNTATILNNNFQKQQAQSLTIKQSQIVKTLQGKELLDLYDKVDHQRKIINDIKRVLGDTLMTDHCILDRIKALQDAQRNVQEEHAIYTRQLMNRHQMQIEDLSGHIVRLQAQLVMAQSNAAQGNTVIAQHQSRGSNGFNKVQAQGVNNSTTTTFLDQLEKINESMMSLAVGAQQPSKNISPRPTAAQSAETNAATAGGLTLRLKEIRQAQGNVAANAAGVRTTEQQAMLELLKTTSSYENSQQQKQMAKTGRHAGVAGSQQHQIAFTAELQQQLQASSTVKVHHPPATTIQTEVPSSETVKQATLLLQKQLPTPVGKASGRNSRRDSGQNITMELSSKREYMDQLCQSPTGPSAASKHGHHTSTNNNLKTATNPNVINKVNYDDTNNTLERASNQDDILGTGKDASTILSSRRRKSNRIVSDFNPGPIAAAANGTHIGEDASKQILIVNHSGAAGVSISKLNGEDVGDKVAPNTTKAVQQHTGSRRDAAVTGQGGAEKDDSLSRVGFFLEKIKERNSSLQERLNLSFKKSSRLDQSSISYRPTTSFGNKKQTALRGTLIERDCISLTRDNNLDSSNNEASGVAQDTSVMSNQQRRPQQQQPNMPPDSTIQLLQHQQQQSSKSPNLIPADHTGGSIPPATSVSMIVNNDSSQQRLLNWDGRKPQLVRQMPAAHQQQLSQQQNMIAQMAKKQQQQRMSKQTLVSPTNNYIDFLQTGNLGVAGGENATNPTGMNTAVAKKSHQIVHVAQRQQQQQHAAAKQHQSQTSQHQSNNNKKSTLSVFEETANQLQSKQPHHHHQHLQQQQLKGTSNSTNLADQTDKGPLFSFYQCTEVLHQLSSTNRSGGHSSKNHTQSSKHAAIVYPTNHPQSSKNSRSMISARMAAGTQLQQRGSGEQISQQSYLQTPQPGNTTVEQQQYSSLLNKQRSSNTTIALQQLTQQTQAVNRNHHQSSSLLEHASNTAQIIKHSSATTNSFIQRASSLEMVPRCLKNKSSTAQHHNPTGLVKHNNYLLPAASQSSRGEQHHHHVRPNSGSATGAATSTAAYWSSKVAQQQHPSTHLHQVGSSSGGAVVTSSKLLTGGPQAAAVTCRSNGAQGSKTSGASNVQHHHHTTVNKAVSSGSGSATIQHQHQKHGNLLNQSLHGSAAAQAQQQPSQYQRQSTKKGGKGRSNYILL